MSPQTNIEPAAFEDEVSPAGADRPETARTSAASTATPRGYGEAESPRDAQGSWAFPPTPPAHAPRPLPKRPKGRLFVGSILFVILATVLYGLWDGLLRYRVYGVVQGRVVEVSPNWTGFVATLHVREGDQVQQGEPLVTVRSMDREQQLERTQDELQLAQANLQARLAELKWEAQLRGDRGQQARGEYFQAWGELSQQQHQLAQADADWQRLLRTSDQNERAVSQKQLDTARFTVDGLRAKVDKLRQAVEQRKRRVETLEAPNEEAATVLRPYLLRIEHLQAEVTRLRKSMDQGVIRAPVNGKVVRVLRYTGEFAAVSQPVLQLVENGSLEPVLYLPQDEALSLREGDDVRVHLHPLRRPLTCRVDRHGQQMQRPPSNIQRYYRKDEQLLPVHLRPPSGESFRGDCLWLGCEVKLPYRWTLPWPTNSADASQRPTATSTRASSPSAHLPLATSRRPT